MQQICQKIISTIHNGHVDEPGPSSLTFPESKEMLPKTSVLDSSNDLFSDDPSFSEKKKKNQ